MKKHFYLSGLGANSVACLRTIHGVTLGNVDGRYFLHVTFIPRNMRQLDPWMATAAIAQA